MPAPPSASGAATATGEGGAAADGSGTGPSKNRRRRRRGRGGGGGGGSAGGNAATGGNQGGGNQGGGNARGGQGGQQRQGGGQKGQRQGGQKGQRGQQPTPVEAVLIDDAPLELDEKTLKRRGGRSRKGRAVGRYQMNVHVHDDATQISILEGRSLVEHYVSRPTDDVTQIHGNIYIGKVENVLPGMEAAFIDIATPKNAVLYRGDVQYDKDDVDSKGEPPRIEDVLKAKQLILCQVTKNPIAHKGARLTQEVSLPGRFVVLVPNSSTYGISKRLPDDERKRLRQLLDRVKPKEHGVIVRTAAEGVTAEEIERDVKRLIKQWDRISELAAKQNRPGLLYREPEMAVRFIREEFNAEYRAVVIDDEALHTDIKEYVEAVAPALADRVEHYDRSAEPLPLFEKFHVAEQLAKALDRKVWLPSGGSLIIEATEALTVIDVNTGRNVGSSSLEETVFRNNLEAADEIARQLRLRDIGGIIVIDFVDMEVKENRDRVVKQFREALSRDKTRTQVFNISDLGLVEMTRKRIGEGLLESVSSRCEHCDGRGVIIPTEFIS
ncbi:MAG: Rne/Rng family ribonuclease [Actinomycetota bacterium]|nr:Rne/Rng family ribonuclease [Actinomycetota bacterium]